MASLGRRAILTAAVGLIGCRPGARLQPGIPPPSLGGGTYTGPPVELSFWNGFTGGDGPVMRGLVQSFNAEHPRIRVRMNAIRWDDFYRKVPVACAVGKGPDIGVMQQHQLAAAASRGVVVPLDALFAEFSIDGRDFLPETWKGSSFQGQHYGLPLDVHLLGMFFNVAAFRKARIEAPPSTGEEFLQALALLRASGFTHPFWMPTLWPAHFIFESLLWQFGGEPFGEVGTRATFASESGVAAARWMKNIIQEGYSPRSVGIDAQWNAFGNGSNAMTWDGIWMIHNTASVPGGAGVAPLPRIGSEPAVWGNAHQLVLFGSPKPDPRRIQAGMVFLAWLSHRSLEWARAGQLPARTSARESPAFASLEPQATLAKQLPYVRLLPSAPGLGELQDDTLLLAVDSALRAESPQAALSSAERLANDKLAALARQYRS